MYLRLGSTDNLYPLLVTLQLLCTPISVHDILINIVSHSKTLYWCVFVVNLMEVCIVAIKYLCI